MSSENVEIVREFFDAYLRNDYEAATARLAPDVVYKVAQEAPAIGPGAVKEIWERWESAWEGLETIPEDYVDAGERVLVTTRYRARGRGSGIEIDERYFEVYALRDGWIVSKVEYTDRSDALKAAGLPG